MKFKFKVLFFNIILLIIGIALSGYFMIDKNISLALDNQIKNAIVENNILQSSVEYPFLYRKHVSFEEITNTISISIDRYSSNISLNNSDTYIIINDKLVYSNSTSINDIIYRLCHSTQYSKKNYCIINEDDNMNIYVCSCNIYNNNKLYVINKKDISEIKDLLNTQLHYYNMILICIILIASAIIYIISTLLTNPLEKLTSTSKAFGNGEYDARVPENSDDEIGELAKTYNIMAQSVSDHVNDLEDMIDRQNQFIADFSHEIKTPLTSIIGYADAIRSKQMSDKNRLMSASYIFNEGKRLESMSRKLFDLIYTKDKNIDMNPIDIADLFTKVENSVTPSLQSKNIELKLSLDNGEIIGEIELLSSAFINLIDNARKASEANSQIEFIGKNNIDNYSIIVKDYGCGISNEHITHIMDAFYMVDKSRSREEGGAGLGLSLAQTIFNKHNANVNIESTLGKGTTFKIIFKQVSHEKNN